MRKAVLGLAFVVLLAVLTGCVNGIGETETNSETEMNITVVHDEWVPPPGGVEASDREEIRLLRTDDGWITESGVNVTDECVEELKELIVRNESNTKCIGENPSLTGNEDGAFREKFEERKEEIEEERRNLTEKLEKARDANDTDRVKKLEERLERTQRKLDEVTEMHDVAQHWYRVVIRYPNSTRYVAETDRVPRHRRDFRWTVEKEPVADSDDVFTSSRLAKVTEKVLSEGTSQEE